MHGLSDYLPIKLYTRGCDVSVDCHCVSCPSGQRKKTRYSSKSPVERWTLFIWHCRLKLFAGLSPTTNIYATATDVPITPPIIAVAVSGDGELHHHLKTNISRVGVTVPTYCIPVEEPRWNNRGNIILFLFSQTICMMLDGIAIHLWARSLWAAWHSLIMRMCLSWVEKVSSIHNALVLRSYCALYIVPCLSVVIS